MNVSKIIASGLLALTTTVAINANAQPFAECAATPMIDFDGTIVDAALATPELSTLVTALTAADLVTTLDTVQDVTVYAPTNDAFAAIPADSLNALLGNVPALSTVLLHHVSLGRLDPRKFINVVRRDVLSGQNVFFHRRDALPRVDNAVLSCQGVRTNNGDVFFIDAVLMPENESLTD